MGINEFLVIIEVDWCLILKTFPVWMPVAFKFNMYVCVYVLV